MMVRFCRFCNCNHELTPDFWYFGRSRNSVQYTCKVAKRHYHQQNRERRLAYLRRWQSEHRERLLSRARALYAEHRESILSRNRDAYLKHGKKWQQRKREYAADRRKHDLNYKLRSYLRSRVNHAVKNGQKAGSAVDALGCSIDDLKLYLESKFLPGMSWDNWGKNGWHIDHVVPLSCFDLTDERQFKIACHYTNLQPLWAKDNLIKGRSVGF